MIMKFDEIVEKRIAGYLRCKYACIAGVVGGREGKQKSKNQIPPPTTQATQA